MEENKKSFSEYFPQIYFPQLFNELSHFEFKKQFIVLYHLFDFQTTKITTSHLVFFYIFFPADS